ncbi:MAG: hypothetical protein CL610_30440 [Anaerolineaceae bacterium]|nr:hypothetical protein [Anaerolineaceae bacterium]
MSQYELAVQLDVEQKLEEAANLYEAVIKESNAPLDSFINLACLYWVSSQPGSSARGEFYTRAGERMYEVLDEAQERFGKQPEIVFWRLYFNQITLGEPTFLDQALDLVGQHNSSSVIYFYLYAEGNDDYIPFVRRLYEDAQNLKTTKNRYILSFLDSPSFDWKEK